MPHDEQEEVEVVAMSPGLPPSRHTARGNAADRTMVLAMVLSHPAGSQMTAPEKAREIQHVTAGTDSEKADG